MTDDPAIQQTVVRLARPNASGGFTIERAALLAEGSRFRAIEAWILERGGEPETNAVAGASAGLHGVRHDVGRQRPVAPARYVLPAAALAGPAPVAAGSA